MKYLSVFIILFFLSCNKDKSCEICTSAPMEENTIIIDGGPPAGDGCSWLVRVNDSLNYHPDVLDTTFQHDQLKVKLNYQITSDEYICGIAATHIPVIHINSISKR